MRHADMGLYASIAKSLSVSDPDSASGTLYEEMLELNVGHHCAGLSHPS